MSGRLSMFPRFLLTTIAAAGIGPAAFAQARDGPRPHPGIDVSDIGPAGGAFQSLAADVLNPGVLYAGARDTGVFKTTDGGASWTKAGLAGLTVVALALDSNTPGSVYAAAGIDIGDGELGDMKLFRSPDQGKTWTRVLSGFPPDCVPISLTSDPRIPGTVYLSACGSVFKSTDTGDTWSEMKD